MPRLRRWILKVPYHRASAKNSTHADHWRSDRLPHSGATMQEPLLHSVTRLLRYQRTTEAATARFHTWKHDADILPKLQQQLEMFLAAHGKFREVIYNTQGILDDGSDMIIR